MKNVMILMLVVALGACSSGKQEKTEEVPASEPQATETTLEVLNPNLATKDQLLSLSLLDEEKVDKIIEGRPYLNSMELINLLSGLVSDEDLKALNVNLFLPMNLNTTEEEDFKNVPGVGDKMAHEFEEYRPYTSIEQFRREIGKYVDEEEVARYENYVFVPVNLNTGSKDEILSIPGVGDRMLHEFEEYRPYENIEQFRREIGKYVDDDELARLERYVTL